MQHGQDKRDRERQRAIAATHAARSAVKLCHVRSVVYDNTAFPRLRYSFFPCKPPCGRSGLSELPAQGALVVVVVVVI